MPFVGIVLGVICLAFLGIVCLRLLSHNCPNCDTPTMTKEGSKYRCSNGHCDNLFTD